MRILLIHTYYTEFLDDLYAADPALERSDFESQRRRVFDTAFCVSDAYSHGLRPLGWETQDVIVNADRMQRRWATENTLELTDNLHDQRRQVVTAQINHYRPDVLFIYEWCPLGDAFLADVKSRVRLTVGQIASPLPKDRTFRAYDLMVSSWPPIVEHFRGEGIDAEFFRLGFDARVGDRLAEGASPTGDGPNFDVTFVGGFAPSHTDRILWLENLLREIDVDVFGYDTQRLPKDSRILAHHRGHAWGWQMYDVLRRSKITLNRHAAIDIRGQVATNPANNMRLYEATGVGTCLLTERRDNLAELFEPDREVVTYADDRECIEKIQYYLTHDAERRAIAEAGQRRTLSEHTYRLRMKEFDRMLRQQL